MKLSLRRTMKVLAVVVLLVALAAAGLAVWWVRRPWPQVEGTVAAAGLTAPVEVIRDRWGIPHLYAQNEPDLFFAQGYVHAQDRLWQMQFNRTVANGQLGELLGAPLVDADRFLRTVGLRRAAERDWEVLGEGARVLLEAYAAGVNHFLETHRGRLPIEFTVLGVDPEPWTPVDSLAWGKLMALNLSFNHPHEILRTRLAAALGEDAVGELMPPYPSTAPVIVEAPGRPDTAARSVPATKVVAGRASGATVLATLLGPPGLAWGSNSWVVAGSRTRSGRPLFANDTHLGLGMPSAWYENGLHGGRFDTVGFSFAGLPFVVVGQNQRLAWGITNMCADVQDFFVEQLDDPEAPTRYEVAGEWHDLEVVVEKIVLKGGETVEHEVLVTRHGPIMNAVMEELKDAEPHALSWDALAGGRFLEGLLGLNLAQDWEGFQAALSVWDSPSLNITYADVDGNIGYQATGKIPLRAAGHDGLVPVPGWSGENEWQGFIPFAEMPRAFNPPEGFIVSANNKVAGEEYPYHLAYDMADGYRAQRIRERLETASDLTPDDVRDLQADVYSLPGELLVPYLLAVEPRGELARRALQEVAAWDHEMRSESPGAAVFAVWFYHLWGNLLGDDLDEELLKAYRSRAVVHVEMLADILAGHPNRWVDDRSTPQVETAPELATRALDDAVAWLGERYGEDPAAWQWGRVHSVAMPHTPFGQSGIAPLERLFNSTTLPAAGDFFTVSSTGYNLDDPFEAVFGVSQRLIVDLADLTSSRAVNSTGQVAHLFHPHREDQLELWSRVEYHPVLVRREAVVADAEATLRLLPVTGN